MSRHATSVRWLVGIDAASQRDKCGYAIAGYVDGQLRIEQSGLIGKDASALEAIARCIRHEVTLVAIDAPLGWPDGMREAVGSHRAGEPLGVPKNFMFRRATDRRLREDGLAPLEVGADRIARAAHEATTLIAELRSLSGRALPMVFSPDLAESGVIEVYPAATLRRHGLVSTGYKKPEDIGRRRQLAEVFECRIGGLLERASSTADEFDACLCVIAAGDFLSGQCEPPPESDLPVVLREGWIWVRRAAKQ